MIEFKEQDSAVFNEVMAVMKRYSNFENIGFDEEPILSLPDLEINLARRKITSDRREISLTAKEYDILCLLVANKKRVLTYAQIYERIWGVDAIGNERKSVGYHVHNLRKKLYGDNPSPPFIIESIREVGYRLQINS